MPEPMMPRPRKAMRVRAMMEASMWRGGGDASVGTKKAPPENRRREKTKISAEAYCFFFCFLNCLCESFWSWSTVATSFSASAFLPAFTAAMIWSTLAICSFMRA